MIYPNNHTARDAILNWLKKHYNIPSATTYVPKSLIAYSGGLDSAALLVTLLRYTNHDIHVHHVDIRNSEGRADAEKVAVERTLNYIKQYYRSFSYTSSCYEMTFPSSDKVGADVSLALFMLSRVNLAYDNSFNILWTGHMAVHPHEYMEAAAIHAAAATNYSFKPLWAMPFYNHRKFHLYTAIPEELVNLSWSCRYPVYDTQRNASPCGNCHACVSLALVRKQVKKLSASQPN